jgi:hypothetical protein
VAEHGLTIPTLALVLWTLVIQGWGYAPRIPAMRTAKIDPRAAPTRALVTMAALR